MFISDAAQNLLVQADKVLALYADNEARPAEVYAMEHACKIMEAALPTGEKDQLPDTGKLIGGE